MILPSISFFLLLSLQISSNNALQLRAEGISASEAKGKPKPRPKPSPTPLSIPADDLDPTSRNIRLNQRARNWQTRKYSESDDFLDITGLVNQARKSSYPMTSPADSFPFVTPTGLLGASTVGQEALFVAMDQLEVQSQNFDMDYPAVYTTVLTQGGFPTLGSFSTAYQALPERNIPSTAEFYDSDVAFAARRLTVSPLYIKRVTNPSQIPFDKSTIVGLDDIIAPSTFEGLISSGKMYMVDYTVFDIASGDNAANAVAEAPIGLFFVSSSGRLMPLAIKFTIQNSLTYSPSDSHADWFLAKAVFNMVDTSVTALVHFVDVHFVLSHVCQAAQQSLASEHPLYAILMTSCSKNDGIIHNGLPTLLSDGGAFDSLLALSGSAIRNKFLVNLGSAYDWSTKGLAEDLAARGAQNIPNYDYATDATALNQIISAYVTSYLSSYYQSDRRLNADTELSTFISKLSSATSAIKINGFPSSVTTISALSAIVTRVIFTSAVQHHSLNSFTINSHFLVYPHSPGKIPFVPPIKGAITDTILKDNILMFGLNLPTFLPFFLGTLSFSYFFIPALQATQRLDNAFFVPTSDGKVDAFVQMRSGLNDLSWNIQARAARDANEGLVPPFTTLDPVNLPFGSTI